MALEKYAKWAIAAAVMWILFFVILFGGVIEKTALIKEYSCTVTGFNVDPRFDCHTKCSVIPSSASMVLDADDVLELADILEKAKELEMVEMYEDMDKDDYEEMSAYGGGRRDPRVPNPGHGDDDRSPHCDDLERDTLKWYSPKLCLKAKWGFEDPLCPAESAVCYTGHNWHRKCHLQCPLAYNITVGLDVAHIGHVEKVRDLGTDADKYKSYKEEYTVGKTMTCQVVKNGDHDVKWVDERMSHKAFAWWKWSLFLGSMLLSLFCTVASIMYYIMLREEHHGNEYDPILQGDDTHDAQDINVRLAAGRVDNGAGVASSSRT